MLVYKLNPSYVELYQFRSAEEARRIFHIINSNYSLPYKMKIFIVKKKTEMVMNVRNWSQRFKYNVSELKYTHIRCYIILSEKWFLLWVWNWLFTIDCVYLTEAVYIFRMKKIERKFINSINRNWKKKTAKE